MRSTRFGYDSDAHTAARETLTVYAEYDSRQRDLDVALQQIPEVETTLQNLEVRRERWQNVLVEEQQDAAAAQVEIEALKEKVEEARHREEELRKRRTEERHALEQVTRVEQALNAIEYARRAKPISNSAA